MARFTASDWTAVDDGWNAIQYKVQVDHPMFFRLRGTNNAMTSSEIDQNSPNIFLFSTRTRATLECGIWRNFCLEAPGRMPGPRGAGILPAAYNSQVRREANGDAALDAQGSTSANAWADLWFYSNPIFVQAGK